VYTLPLHHTKSSETKPPPDDKATPKPFKPAASELTVHTKGNRLALENQLRTGKQAPEKAPLPFENKLILGHVSLLTDLIYVSLPASQSPYGTDRQYILTSDRDEHIRVSRGLPQAHITETYCLGHTEFISRLCIPKWKRDVLISGGGDSFLLVWRWHQARLLQKVDLSQPVTEHLQGKDQSGRASSNGPQSGMSEPREVPLESEMKDSLGESRGIAVTGLWSTRHDDSRDEGQIIVSCEG